MSGIVRHREKQLAKAIELIYEWPGELKKGWEAQPSGQDAFLVKRANGTTRLVKIHEPLITKDGHRIPQIDERGLLMIGDWSVLIGNGIKHGMHARKAGRAHTYLVFNEKMRNLGEHVLFKEKDGKEVSLLAGHLLKVGEDIIPIMPKKKEIQLNVMDKDFDNGKLAYINVIIPGDPNNRKNAPCGEFLQPKREGEPAQFVEVVGDQKVVTALFHITPKGNRLDYRFRDGATAVLVNMLVKKQQECKDVAIRVGIDPDEYHEYVEVTKTLVAAQSKWQKGSMLLSTGAEMFRPKVKERSYDGPQP